MVSSQKSEDLTPSSALAGGVPGTASNLPRPPARAAGGSSGASRRSEEVNYQSSRVLRRVRLPLGELKRVSVSLLIDQDVRWEGKPPNLKQVLIPPSPEKLKTIRDLVAGAISFKAERGDQLIVETLPFEATLRSEPPEPPASSAPPAAPVSPIEKWMRNPKILIGAAGGLVLLLVLAVFGMRRLGRRRAGHGAEVGTALPAGGSVRAVTAGESAEDKMEAHLAGQADRQARLNADALDSIKLPNAGASKSEALTKYLRRGYEEGPRGPGADPANMAPRKQLDGRGGRVRLGEAGG
jgi:flagellar M-ring protein FliF